MANSFEFYILLFCGFYGTNVRPPVIPCNSIIFKSQVSKAVYSFGKMINT